MHVTHKLAAAATAVTLALAVPAVGQTYQTVALSGRPAPGAGAGVNYASFGTPALNDAGQVAYFAFLTGTGVTGANDSAIFAGGFAAPRLVAREGSAAPGAGAGVNYSGFSTPALSDAGQVAYFAGLTGTGVTGANDETIYAGDFATPQLVAREGSAAPGAAAGVNYSFLNPPALNDAGQVAYLTFLTGAGTTANDSAIFAGGFAAPRLVAREGSAAPGTPAGVNYSSFDTPALNDAGQVAYRAVLTGTGVTSANNTAIYAGGLASPQLVAREGNAAPGAGAGVNYSFFLTPVLSDAGQVAYLTILTGSGVTAANEGAIYAGGPAAPQLVARAGNAAPGAGAGVNYSFLDTPALNDAGLVAYRAGLTGTGVTGANRDAIFAGGLAAPQLVARTGDAAPGAGAGVNYSSFSTPVLSDAGQVAYLTTLTGTGVTDANDFGLFAADLLGNDLLIAREGDLFDVDPTAGFDLRTITDGGISFLIGRGDDTLTGLGNDGTLAFQLSFTDGTSGLFTAVVPEPSSLAVLGLGGVALLRRR